MSRRSAVSLVEILVVIGIIGVISAIVLIAANGSSRAKAETANLQAKMKQIGTAITLYRIDSDGALPNRWNHHSMTAYLNGPEHLFYSGLADDLPANFRHGYFDLLSAGMRDVSRPARSEALVQRDVKPFDPDLDIWLQCPHIARGEVSWSPFGKGGKEISLENLPVQIMALKPDLSVKFAPYISCWELRGAPPLSPLLSSTQIDLALNQCDNPRK